MSTAPNRAPVKSPDTEVRHIRDAIARLDQIVARHQQHSGDEGFLGSLNRMDVGDNDTQKVHAALEASKNAARLWAAAAKAVRAHNEPVGQAYAVSPGAANKHANTNE